MTRRSWVIVIILVSLLVAAGCVGVTGIILLHSYRGHGAFLRAEQAYSEGRWADAKNNYGWYLARHPGDPPVLGKYIDSCLKLLNGRPGNLRDAGRAYLQLALATPSDRDLVQQVVDFHKKHGLWQELEYTADVFLRKFPGDTVLGFDKALAIDHLRRAADAVAAYQRLVESGAAPPEAYGNLALLLQQQGLQEQGWQVVEKALAEQPDDPRIRVERARFLLAVNEVTRAAQEIDAALTKGGETGEALLVAARVRAAQKDWKTAQSLAEKAVNKLPEEADGYFIIVNGYLANHQADQAVALLSGIDPYVLADNPELYLLLAEIQIDAGMLKDAEHTVEMYRTAYPNESTVPAYLAARALLRQGLASDAVSKLEVVVGQAPEFRVARYFLGLAYLETGQKERAKNTLELYLRNNPGDERARAIWDATFAERSPEDVEAAALKLLDSDTAYSGSLIVAAHSLMREKSGAGGPGKQLELARRLLERAIEQSPSAPEGYRDLAFLCVDQGDLETARQVLDRAEKAGIAPSELSLVQAGLALKENKLDQAKACCDTELALGAMAPQRATQWAELFTDRGHLEAGLELLESVRTRETVEENRQELDLAQVALCMRSANVAKALALIESLSSKYPEIPTVAHRLDDDRIAIARALLAPGDRQDKPTAERLIAEVGRIEPDRTDAKVLRARLLLDQNPPDVDSAETLCATARKAGASDAEVLLTSSDVAARKGQFTGALDYAVQANEKSPDNANIQMALARAQLQTERFTDAITTLEKVRSRQPENRTALDFLARAYAGAGRFRDAEALVQRLEAMEGGRAAVSLRASLLIARGEWVGAEQLLRQQHDADPDDLWTIHFLVRAMAGQGQRDRAESFLNECVVRRPEVPELWVELGNSYLTEVDAARLSKASFAFTQALVHRAGYLPALRGLLEVQVRSGNLGGALGLCNRFLAENPDDPDMLERKAFLLTQLPDLQKEALSTIQRAIEITQRPEFFYRRGYLRLSLGDFANAIEDFQRVIQARGAAPGDLDSLIAEAYLGLNNSDLAHFYYNSAKEKASKGEPVDSARLERIAARLAEAQNK
jgi:tetratricopeptide (TPR) repeat protein